MAIVPKARVALQIPSNPFDDETIARFLANRDIRRIADWKRIGKGARLGLGFTPQLIAALDALAGGDQ